MTARQSESATPTAKGDLRRRIDLSNRPKLSVDSGCLRGAAASLASDSALREEFVRNPAAYLNRHAIPVQTAGLRPGGSHPGTVTHTTETITTYVVCSFVVAFNCLVTQNANSYVVQQANSYVTQYIMVMIEVYGAALRSPSAPWSDQSLNSQVL
jgi:hypothetical protein